MDGCWWIGRWRKRVRVKVDYSCMFSYYLTAFVLCCMDQPTFVSFILIRVSICCMQCNTILHSRSMMTLNLCSQLIPSYLSWAAAGPEKTNEEEDQYLFSTHLISSHLISSWAAAGDRKQASHSIPSSLILSVEAAAGAEKWKRRIKSCHNHTLSTAGT